MIKPFPDAWTCSDGKVYDSREAAQQAEIELLVRDKLPSMENVQDVPVEIARLIVANQVHILDVITTTKDSRPTRRKVNGYPGHTKRNKTPKEPVAEAPTPSDAGV